MRVRLIRKFANFLNGIDLTNFVVGDVVEMKAHHAAVLVAEGWAEEVPTEHASRRQTEKPDTSESVT